MAIACEAVKTWFIDKYARFVPSDRQGQGEWKYFSSFGGNNQLKISLVNPLKILVTSGSGIVLESIPLHKKYEESPVKAICKGDSMLFFVQVKDSTRRFRIKFGKGFKSSEKENCQDFIQAIASFIQLKAIDQQDDEMNSQRSSQSLLPDNTMSQHNLSLEYEYAPPKKINKNDAESQRMVPDAKIFSPKSIRQIAESLMKKNFDGFPECYKSSYTVNEKDVDNLLRSCLLDPDFPSFVGQVEGSLQKLLSE